MTACWDLCKQIRLANPTDFIVCVGMSRGAWWAAWWAALDPDALVIRWRRRRRRRRNRDEEEEKEEAEEKESEGGG